MANLSLQHLRYIYITEKCRLWNRAHNPKFTGSNPVPATKHEITSGSINNNSIALRTKDLDGPKCGVIRFNGEIEGNKLVGKVPWNGVQTDLELRKQN